MERSGVPSSADGVDGGRATDGAGGGTGVGAALVVAAVAPPGAVSSGLVFCAKRVVPLHAMETTNAADRRKLRVQVEMKANGVCMDGLFTLEYWGSEKEFGNGQG